MRALTFRDVTSWTAALLLCAWLSACGRTSIPVGSETSRGSGGTGAPGGTGTFGGFGGSGGTSAREPRESRVAEFRQANAKLDLLFVIDNSISMGDKQSILARSVSGMVSELVNPDCIQWDELGNVIQAAPAGSDPASPCPQGWARERTPINDIHIGVITSSLGSHGGEVCSPRSPTGNYSETQNDKAWLLPTVRPQLALPSHEGLGFLSWNPAQTTPEQLSADLTQHLNAAGDAGCGYEATLEAWYRFLIDPSPPLEIVSDGVFARPRTDDDGHVLVDATLLAQREQFLRPDSVVAVVMLTDENDCSVIQSGYGWLTTQATAGAGSFTMPAATAACDENPNDRCCRSCGLYEASPPPGCVPLHDDQNCQAGRPTGSDSLGLRCWNQKQRFGFDLLYPIERYVAGLSDAAIADPHVCDGADCPPVQNPLFAGGGALLPRSPFDVYMLGIVGVPWQDIATDESLGDSNTLEYLSAVELNQRARWQLVLGTPEAANPADPNALPFDPLMHEQLEPRTGSHPITGEPLAPATSTNPQENSINGHETINSSNDHLQYSCIFPLEEPRSCAGTDDASCACTETDLPRNRPLCSPPGGGVASTTQYFAKAYPSSRILQLLRDFGDNAVVASVCPKIARDALSPSYGYRPAMRALLDRMGERFGPRCLPEALPVDASGLVPCSIVEVTLTPASCDRSIGRLPVPAEVASLLREELERAGRCGEATAVSCDAYYLCEISQLDGADGEACRTQLVYQSSMPGVCYLDDAQGLGTLALVEHCPEGQRQRLRFVGEQTPNPGASTFLVCAPGVL